jgi:hypothetical protein
VAETKVKPTDDQILAALHSGGQCMTYVVANRISMAWKSRPFDTAFILRRLKALEKAGKVERVPSSYAVQICWRARPLTNCAAGRDGECGHALCPQLRDNEPRATGRHCPLDNERTAA